jgi:hypothetical protein
MPPQLPPRLLAVLYFGVAHVAVALAFAAVAADPRGVSGFFYHTRMLGVVHLVTLGWITASILGSLYIVGPIALRVGFPAGGLDYSAFALVVTGIVGMVAHFWLEEYGGMAWSAAIVGAGIVAAGTSIVRRLRGAAIPTAVSAHIVLAFVNVLGAATIGTLIGFDKEVMTLDTAARVPGTATGGFVQTRREYRPSGNRTRKCSVTSDSSATSACRCETFRSAATVSAESRRSLTARYSWRMRSVSRSIGSASVIMGHDPSAALRQSQRIAEMRMTPVNVLAATSTQPMCRR